MRNLRTITVAAIVLGALYLAVWPAPVKTESTTAPAFVNAELQATGNRAVVGSGGTSLFATPGGELIRELTVGENLTAVGRTADGVWMAVRTADDTTGWVLTEDVLMFGAAQLPVVAGDRVPSGDASGGPVTLPTPTATPEVTPTPVPTVTPVPTEIPIVSSDALPSEPARNQATSQVAVVRSGGAVFSNTPGGEQAGTLPTGTAVTVSGRTEDGAWLAAITPQGQRGWVPAADVVTFNAGRLPVVDSIVASGADLGATDLNTVTAGVTEENPAAQAIDSVDVDSITSSLDSGIVATVAVTDSRLNVRSGPGIDFRVLAKAVPGEQFSAVGRSEDAEWIQIAGGELGSDTGWVAGDFVSLTAPSITLPVANVEASADRGATATGQLNVSQSPRVSTQAATGLDGTLAVQTSLGGDIYLVDLPTGAARYLTTGFDPAISPDGSTVAYTRDGGDHGLYLLDIDGSNERRIYSGGEGLRSPTWSPDGEYVLFSRLSGEWECRDVGFGICLPDNPFLSDFDLTTKPEYGLSRVNRDGGEFRDLPALTSAKAPSWAEGGITYQSNTGLEITRDEPGATTQLLLSAPYYQDPDWQPGSDRIVFQSREGSHWEIFSVARDGSGLFALTRPVTTLVDELPSNVAPAWSPDGTQIVYLSNRNDRNDAGEWRLWVMNADGSGQRPLAIDLPLDYTYSAEQVVDWGVNPQ